MKKNKYRAIEMISDCFSNALFRIKMILFPAKKKELDEFLEALEKSFEMHIKEGVDNENKS